MNFFSFFVGLWVSLMSLFGASTPDQYSMPIAPAASSSAQIQTTTQAPVPAPSAQTTSASAQANVTSIASAPSVTSDLPATGHVWSTTLPLGDGKYTTSGPKKGYIYVCHVAQGGGGAQGNPTWIHGSTWNPSEKVFVQGSVSWPNATYSMAISGSTRIIKSNGLPTDHTSGIFPIQTSDPAHQFDANPNSIKAQSYSFSFPVSPTTLAQPDCIYGQVGIMNDGVPLFDGFDAEYRDAVAHETQDAYEAHPDVTGVYHYHGFEKGFVQESIATVVGFAFDGFPITGAKLADGTYLQTSDLDECHGLTSTINLDGKNVTTYHYVLTQDFPYSVSCFRGKSYEPKPGGGQSQPINQTQGGGQQSGAPTPPQGALEACSGKTSGASCSFSTPNGSINGTCHTPPGQSVLACVPQQ
ncbi:MAG TPA: YHYH protein [Candidatus Paceibacterota bacterium]|nr:YHYH protein [Candidatus Paceibacterota bacterium]